MHEARTISELEEGTICVNEVLRRNLKLASENQDLYHQIHNLRKEHRVLQIRLSSELPKKLDSTCQRESKALLRCVRDKLKNELASVCEENKKLHIEIQQLKSALTLKEQDSKSINRKLILLKDKLREHSKGDHKLGILLRSLDKDIDYTYKTADSQVSIRTDKRDAALTSESITCTSVESNKIETQNGIQAQLELKEHELKMMASNTDSGIGDSLGQGKELQHIDSDRSFNHSVADETLDNSVKMSLNERKGFESMMESLQISNENLTREIYDLKNTNEQIKQEFTMKLTDMQMMNSELENKIKGYNLIEEQMAQIQEQNYLLEIENRKLQNFMEEANCRKGEIGEPEMKLETKESMKLQENCSTNADNKMFKMLAMKSEERDAFAEECSKLRQEIEDMTMSIEDLAENITGMSINGQGVAAAIDIITACCFEDREHTLILQKELEAVGAGRMDHTSSKSNETQKEEDSRSSCCIFQCERIPKRILSDLKTECNHLRKSIIDLEMKNDDLYEMNERLIGEKDELELQTKTLQKDLQGMQLSKINNVDCFTNHEVQFDWSEIGQLIKADCERKQIQQGIIATDKEYIKEQLIRLVEEYHRLKRTENLVKQQSLDNHLVRQRLAVETSRNNEMCRQLSKLALRERQFHEVKTKLSKACSARNILQRDVEILTERITEYEKNYKQYKDIIGEFEYVRLQHDKIHGEKLKLEELVQKYRKVVKILQNKNEMFPDKNETLEELECREDIASIDDGFRGEEKELQSY